MHAIRGRCEYYVSRFGPTIVGISGERSKEGDESFRLRTQRGQAASSLVMVEVGYPGGINFLRLDAKWWLLNAHDNTRFVILMKIERDLFALHIEWWMMVETGCRRTRHTPSRIPGRVQDFDINAVSEVT